LQKFQKKEEDEKVPNLEIKDMDNQNIQSEEVVAFKELS
jgi:hypothetical protein